MIKYLLVGTLLSSSAISAPLLFSESWDSQNTPLGLESRGWTDGTSSIGKGYTFEYNNILSKNVLCINWDSSDKEPKGASSLQKAIVGTENGATMHVGFKTTNFYNHNKEGQTHFLRFLQNWNSPWGGMGPAPNQLNLDMGAAKSPDLIYASFGTKGADASKAFFYAGGTYASHATYINSTPKRYLVDEQWYEIRSYMLPQKIEGQKTGKIVTDYRKVGDSSWINIISANGVELTDASGLITKFAIGPYRQNPSIGDKLCVSFIKVYGGDAISDGTIGKSEVSTPVIINIKCTCKDSANALKCSKIPGTKYRYTCPNVCPKGCTVK